MDVAAWLQGLGLERYVPAFRDNEIVGTRFRNSRRRISKISAWYLEAIAAGCSMRLPRSAPRCRPP